MKKWLIIAGSIAIALCAGIYLLVPDTVNISETIVIRMKLPAANRVLLDKTKWIRWWPKTGGGNGRAQTGENGSFTYDGYRYQINRVLYNRIEILAADQAGSQASAILDILDLNNDSIAIRWQYQIGPEPGPLARVRQFRFAGALKKNLAGIMESLRSFLGKTQNVYMVDIREVIIVDTALISSARVFSHYPSTKDVYSAIKELRKYIASAGARETNYPMLNIADSGSDHYMMKVAIPTNRLLNNQGHFNVKRMPPVRILTADVKGGPDLIRRAFDEMGNYARDYQLGSPAIPFESLVTDRASEPDTAKWITRLYYPIY